MNGKKKKRKLSTSRQRQRSTADLKRATEAIRKDMNTAGLSRNTAVRLFNDWVPPFTMMDKFERFDWNDQKIKTRLAGMKMMRFEADSQTKLWVTLENDDALHTGMFDDALRAVISESGVSTGKKSMPDEIIVQTTQASTETVEAHLEQMLDDIRATGGGASLAIAEMEEPPSGKGKKVIRFRLGTGEPDLKRPKKEAGEKDLKDELPPIATLGRTPPTGSSSGAGGKKTSGSGQSDSGSGGKDGDDSNSNKREREGSGAGSGAGGRDDDRDDDDRDRKRRREKDASDEDERDDDEDAEEEDDDENEEEEDRRGRKRGRKSDDEGDDNDRPKKQRKTEQEADIEEDDNEDDAEEGSSEEEGPVRWVTPEGPLRLANLRHGISLNNYSIEELESLPELHYAYQEHPHQNALLQIWEAQGGSAVPLHYAGGRVVPLPHPLNAPAAIIAELTPQQVLEIQGVKSKKDLDALLKKYADAGAVELFLAAWLHHGESKWLAKERDSIRLIRLILTPVEKLEDTEDTIKSVLKLLPQRINKKKLGTVLETINLIQEVLNESGFFEDYKNKEAFAAHVEAIKKILEGEDNRFKLFLSLYDYANTLYAQFRDALETPWHTPEAGQTKDTLVQKRAIILAAQLALLQEEMPAVPEDQWIFRWVEGIEHFYPGQLITPMALWSATQGSQASEAFGGSGERTFFMIRNCRSCRHIQLLTGTKNWYQREVLFPAYTQLVVKIRHEFKTDRTDKSGEPVREVGYVLEEVEDGIQQYLNDAIPLIGLPVGNDQYPFPDDFLLRSLVDQKHQQLFEGGITPTGETLEQEGIELNGRDKAEHIPLALIYGAETHEAWYQMMKRKDRRRDILTLDMLKQCYFGLKITDEKGHRPESPEDVVFRDFEDGWGSDGIYFELNEAQRNVLQTHGLLFYPTISHAELQLFINWINSKRGKEIQTIAGSQNRAEYLQELRKKFKKISKDQDALKLRMPLTEELMEGFWNWKEAKKRKSERELYNPDEQQYEVTYGDPMDGDENVMLANLTGSLDKFSIALEQSLALYLEQKVTRQEYTAWVYRFAALVQQSIVAAHPFADGNGRLSRLIMYKVLMAYLPEEVLLAEGLPLIQEPGNDLFSTEEEWAKILLESPKMRVTAVVPGQTSSSPGNDKSDSDDAPDDTDKKKPQGGFPPPGFGGGGSDKSSSGDSSRGGRLQPQPRHTYHDSRLGGARLQVFTTSGGGNCGIHAMNGQPNNWGYQAPNHLQIRQNLAAEILRVKDGPLKAQFVQLLNELLHQTHSAGVLRGDMKTLWENMAKRIPNLRNMLNAALEESRTGQEGLQSHLERIERAISKLLLDGQANTRFLREQMRIEILLSQESKLAYLQEQVREIQSEEDFIRLLSNLDEHTLLNLIFENLDTLIRQMEDHIGFDKITGTYWEYQANAVEASSLYKEFTLQNFDALMRAYSDSVAAEGYYLRDLDLQVLADMSNQGVIIYIENSDRPGHFVEAVNHNPQDHANVVEVFHIGQHYERAHLLNPARQPLLTPLREIVH